REHDHNEQSVRACDQCAEDDHSVEKDRNRCGCRPRVSGAIFCYTRILERRKITCRVSYLFWRRTISRRLNDASALVQSTSPHKSDVRCDGSSTHTQPRNATNLRLQASGNLYIPKVFTGTKRDC